MSVCLYMGMHVYVHMYSACTHIHKSICMYVYIHICMNADTHICCMHVDMLAIHEFTDVNHMISSAIHRRQ